MSFSQKQANAIANRILDDISGRSGFDHVMDSVDDDVKKEMVDDWSKIIYELGQEEPDGNASGTEVARD